MGLLSVVPWEFPAGNRNSFCPKEVMLKRTGEQVAIVCLGNVSKGLKAAMSTWQWEDVTTSFNILTPEPQLVLISPHSSVSHWWCQHVNDESTGTAESLKKQNKTHTNIHKRNRTEWLYEIHLPGWYFTITFLGQSCCVWHLLWRKVPAFIYWVLYFSFFLAYSWVPFSSVYIPQATGIWR